MASIEKPEANVIFTTGVQLDGVGVDHWEGSKVFLKGHVRGIDTRDEICVVAVYPGSSNHHAISSTESTKQYIYFNGTSGDYDLAANGHYISYENPGNYALKIIDVSGNCENWSTQRDYATFVLVEEVSTVSLDEIGVDHWEGSKALLKGHVRDIATSDEICVVLVYPGSSDHHAIPSTATSRRQYIYFNGTSGDYDLAADGRYVPYENPGTYALKIIDVSGNCEDWSGQRDYATFSLIAEMELIPVVSSNLAAAGWIPPSTLEILFISGSQYRYTGVPESVFDQLLDASSKGKYFWEHIRCKTWDCSGGNIPYPYERIK